MNDINLLENQPIAWTPTEEVVERAQLTRFMKQVGANSFDELYQFSINEVEKFTSEVLHFLEIKFNPPYEKLLDLSGGVEFPNWCAGAGLNIAEMCVDRWIGTEIENQPAIIFESESEKNGVLAKFAKRILGQNETCYSYAMTYRDLFDVVELWAGGL